MPDTFNSPVRDASLRVPPYIKGAVIKDARDWMRHAYGVDAYKAGLQALSEGEREMVDGQLLAGSWYPVATWDRWLRTFYTVGPKARGESEDTFVRRNLREAGSATLRSLYGVVLKMFSAERALRMVPNMYARWYSHGTPGVEILGKDRALLTYLNAHAGMAWNIERMFVGGTVAILELNGAKSINTKITKSEVKGEDLHFAFEVTFQP